MNKKLIIAIAVFFLSSISLFVFAQPANDEYDNNGSGTAPVGESNNQEEEEEEEEEANFQVTYTAPRIEAPRRVVLQDNQIPVITLLGDATVYVNLGDTYTDDGATANDDTDGNITPDIVTANLVDTNIPGDYTVTYNVEDAAGNKAVEVIRTVKVVDPEAPVITLTGDDEITLELGMTYTEDGATAVDNYDPVVAVIIGGDTVDTSVLGTYVVTYDAQDVEGNDAIQIIRTVHVIPAQPEAIIFFDKEDSSKANVGNAWEAPGYNPGVIETNPTATYEDWIYARSYDEYDDTEYIIGSDLPCMNGGTNCYFIKYAVVKGAPATLTSKVDLGVVGSYYIGYRVYDTTGHSTYRGRWVDVVDTVKPVITVTGSLDITIEAKLVGYVDEGAAAFDNYDGDITANIVVGGDVVDADVIGDYVITYNVVDSSGNVALEATRTVHVVDTTKPVVTLIGDNNVKLEVGMPYVEEGATAFDNYDGDITANIVTKYKKDVLGQWKKVVAIDTSAISEYKVKYVVKDSSGNKRVKLRFVHVVATAPEGLVFFDKNDNTEADVGSAWEIVEASAGDIYTDWVRAKAYDAYDNTTYYAKDCLNGGVCYEIKYTNDGIYANLLPVTEINLGNVGIYKVLYRVYDATGHSNYRYRWVYVEDTTKPTITLDQNFPTRYEEGMIEPNWADAVLSYDDNANGMLLFGVVDNVDMNTPGNYKVGFTVTETNTNVEKYAGAPRIPLFTQVAIYPEVVKAKPENIVFTLGEHPTFEADKEANKFPDAPNYGLAWDEFDQEFLPVELIKCKLNNSLVTVNEVMGNPGDYRCKYKVTDSTGNIRKTWRKITIEDTTKPKVVSYSTGRHEYIQGNINAKKYVDKATLVTWDNQYGPVTVVALGCKVNLTKVGDYKCKYKITDFAGNTIVRRRFIHVIDAVAPVIKLLGDDPIEIIVGEAYIEYKATAYDSYDGNITGDIVTDSSNVNNNQAGTYLVTYNVSDSNGNAANEVTRTVNVVEAEEPNTAPTITLLGSSVVNIFVGDSYSDAGATADDAEDGNITGAIITVGDVIDTSTAGTHTVTYNVQDSESVAATEVTRTVIVSESNVIYDPNYIVQAVITKKSGKKNTLVLTIVDVNDPEYGTTKTYNILNNKTVTKEIGRFEVTLETKGNVNYTITSVVDTTTP